MKKLGTDFCHCINVATPKGHATELKVLKHLWGDATSRKLQCRTLHGVKQQTRLNGLRIYTHLVEKLNEASHHPEKLNEASSHDEVVCIKLSQFSDPHEIYEKQVVQCLVASLPDGKDERLGP